MRNGKLCIIVILIYFTMKYNFFIIICMVSAMAFCQTPAQINKAIGLPDSLTYRNEIRIYQSYIITNGTDVFRMYEIEEHKWMAEHYLYTGAIESQDVEEHFTKTELTTIKYLNFTWMDIYNTDIVFIPDAKTIGYKLKTKDKLIFEEGKYLYDTITGSFNDGIGYEIFINYINYAKKYSNYVAYSNPEAFLKEYPGVDELESVVGLINIIRNDFNIWKE